MYDLFLLHFLVCRPPASRPFATDFEILDAICNVTCDDGRSGQIEDLPVHTASGKLSEDRRPDRRLP